MSRKNPPPPTGGRPPKVPTERGQALVLELARLDGQIDRALTEVEALRRLRRRLWMEALDEGLTSRRLAELTGCGTTTVERELARAREEALA